MGRKKHEVQFNFLEPIKVGNDRLTALVDPMAVRCFEDPDYENVISLGRVSKLIEAIEVVRGRKKGDVGFSEGILRNLRMNDLNDDGLEFAGLMANGYRATIDHLNTDASNGEHGQRQWESGLAFSHAWKELFTWTSDKGWSKEEILGLFDKVFEERHMSENMAEMNAAGLVNGLEAELNAFLLLKEIHPEAEVKFADREMDGKKKVDLVVIDDKKLQLIQVKNMVGEMVSELSLDDNEGVELYLANAEANNKRRKLERDIGIFRQYVAEVQTGTSRDVTGAILFSSVRREKYDLRRGQRKKFSGLVD